ncbi:MAG: succinate dehydrogenase/fumarate reductase iron-sulfur subunit [Holophagales bacterium]|jgi:succinate dehydrogenase / fumarate reductase iron-sulfur subunit|nr:succinate dehydrogenase/fumarate reductase iron-sulfur subunit [Holophagales bacterium]
MSEHTKNLTLKIWRQKSARDEGHFETYQANNISPEMSFLEMLDVINEELIHKGVEPITMDHDCREGICGACGLVINGRPHGPRERTTTCQLHMRSFRDGDTITIEPFRAKAFPVIKDLMIDRGSMERIIAAGGFITAPTGSPRDANALPVPKTCADLAMDAASCIGCGACVAACPNASAMLFLSAKVSQLGLLPQGQPERLTRVRDMIAQMDAEQFGACTNFAECEAVCPKGVKLEHIARMNRDFIKSAILYRPPQASAGGA